MNARIERHRWFDPHIGHLRNVMDCIRIAAPLAIADGAAVHGDDNLVASVFALETRTLAVATDLMRADPYWLNGVWEGITLFDVDEAYGEWISPSQTNRVTKRLYALLAGLSEDSEPTRWRDGFVAHRDYMLQLPTLFGARLMRGASIGAGLGQNWGAVAFVLADSLDAAKSMAAGDPNVVKGLLWPQVWAIPMAVGSWTDMATLLRGQK
ncbi:MAG: hypothetical protein JWN85_4490 [Gammaproteobacteria bacterium]|nr:hypothetical protein [Gammaproteobacteria bacterium]